MAFKNVYIRKKTTVRKKTVQNGELKFYGRGAEGFLYSIEQIQGNIGTDF